MNKDEFNRLDRAKKKADKKNSQEPLREWAIQLEQQLADKTKKFYDDLFEKKMSECIEWYLIAIAYTLHFNEKCKFGAKRLQDVMNDLQSTVELFSAREYTADDYVKQLEEDGIILKDYIRRKANEETMNK